MNWALVDVVTDEMKYHRITFDKVGDKLQWRCRCGAAAPRPTAYRVAFGEGHKHRSVAIVAALAREESSGE